MKMQKKWRIFIILVLGIIISDQATKIAIINNFSLGESLPILDGFFNLTLVYNPGAAFGMLASLDPKIREPFFIVIPALTLIAILYALHQLKDEQIFSIYGLVSIIGGAIGNLIDRFRFQYVIDFLDFHYGRHHFPAFNIADSAICIGVFLIILSIFFESDEFEETEKTEKIEEPS